ncbi:hypothetical protein [Bacillus benzoevorans]|uniref:Uncharacterized protein n=1 Tax=Bacillus benzoevorans TaxID=1456 RepID=A0A7X0LYM8_9BACI|nr:hypothetical protein [Bacillus benzoevorans]MBB6447599.1 hypothetical protein [Bacillus benzoevorans]
MLKQEILNRLYELIGLEEQRLTNNRKFAEVFNEKRNLEETIRKSETQPKQKYARVLPVLSALCLSIVIAIILFENLFVQFIMCLVFVYPLTLLFGKAYMMIKRIKATDENIFFLKNSTYIEELKKDIQKYEIEVEKYEAKENDFVDKIKQKAAFLPSSYHNLSSFQSLYDYLYYGQADTLGEALHLHEKQVRHEESMKIYQEIRFEQQRASQKLDAMQIQLEENHRKTTELGKEVENLGNTLRSYR